MEESWLVWSYFVVSFYLFMKIKIKLIFLGAGGLGIGMELSQFVDIKYAVEYSPSAAKTYKSVIFYLFIAF